jgi:hypothetical protein
MLSTPRPILDEYTLQFTPRQALPLVKPKRTIYLYIAIGILGLVALLAICLLLSKQVLGATNIKNLLPLCVVPTGYLQANDNLYINVSSRIFGEHPTNFAMDLTLGSDPQTVWIQEFVDEKRTQFVFKTEIMGLMYSMQVGPPGTGTQWGVAYVAPLVRALNTNVIIKNNQSSMIAVTPAWPDGGVFLTKYDNKDSLFWTSSPGNQLSSLRLVQN